MRFYRSVIFMFSFGPSAFASSPCENLVISYMGSLLEAGVLNRQNLEQFVAGTKDRGITNPISITETQLSSAAWIHRQALEVLLDKMDSSPDAILDWTRAQIEMRDEILQKREMVRGATGSELQGYRFNPVPPGKFNYWGRKKGGDTVLTNAFEVMSTVVTQKMWFDEMGTLPSGNPWSTVTPSLKPNYPIQNVTWWSAAEFANKLSERRGLSPAYDFSQIQWMPGTSKEAGTLSPRDWYHAKKMRINSPTGSIYDAEGYRLMTVAEFRYLASNLGSTSLSTFPLNLRVSELDKYFVIGEGTDSTEEVDERYPLNIAGHNYFGLIGNVSQWMHDGVPEEDNVRGRGATNPAGPKSFNHWLVGGSYKARVGANLYVSEVVFGSPDLQANTSFRLVRTLK